MSFNSDWLQKTLDKRKDKSDGDSGKGSGIMHRLSSMSVGSGFNLLGVATKLSTDEDVSDNTDAASVNDSGLSYGDRFKGFVVMLLSSSCFFLIAFTFLPTVILFPRKICLVVHLWQCPLYGKLCYAGRTFEIFENHIFKRAYEFQRDVLWVTAHDIVFGFCRTKLFVHDVFSVCPNSIIVVVRLILYSRW